MTFLNFSQLPESVFRPIFPGKHFPRTKLNFPLTGKCFPLTNFSNGKQTQESLESGFPESKFRKTNIAKEIFIVAIIIHSLQEYHIHYGMYVLA